MRTRSLVIAELESAEASYGSDGQTRGTSKEQECRFLMAALAGLILKLYSDGMRDQKLKTESRSRWLTNVQRELVLPCRLLAIGSVTNQRLSAG